MELLQAGTQGRMALLSALVLASCAGSPPPIAVAPPVHRIAPQVAQWDHEWARGAVFYEVFVRSFADSNGDGIGDLQGLTSKLDYLNDGDPKTDSDLGVDALWLMPVFRSPSDHGNDTTDYEAINPDYGTEADFDRLLAEAHRRGIKVIVDLVMPDLNYATPAVRQEMERIAALWLRRGVDGFRLDATRHLFANGPGDLQNDQPETHEFLKELSASVRSVAPRSVLVGENWTETPIIATYFGSTAQVKGGDELPISFDFPLAEQILWAVHAGDAGDLGAKLLEIAKVYPPGVIDAPFLTNHDQTRIGTVLADYPEGLRSSAAVLLTLPGAPFLYYGEEIGLQNGAGGKDEFKRTPMPWDASPGGGFTTSKPWFDFAPGREKANVQAEQGDAGSLLSWYRKLLRVRQGSAALRTGTLTLLSPADHGTPVLAYVRQADGERVLVVHNLSGSEQDAGPYAVPGEKAEALLAPDGAAPVKNPEGWKVRLPAGASGVWRLR